MAHEKIYVADKKLNFLDSAEGLVLKSCTVPESMGTDDGFGNKTVKAGTVFPANDSTATGILYESVDVTMGDHEGSLMVAGRVIEDRLSETLEEEAKLALQVVGISFHTEEAVVRPELDTIS